MLQAGRAARGTHQNVKCVGGKSISSDRHKRGLHFAFFEANDLTVLRLLHAMPTRAEVDAMFNEMDTNGDGFISRGEWTAAQASAGRKGPSNNKGPGPTSPSYTTPAYRLSFCSRKIAGHAAVMPHLRLNKVDPARDTELAKETLEWSKQLREGTGAAAQ